LKLGILASHPIQYQAPLFRELGARPGVDLEVLFCHDHGVEPTFDAGFGRVVRFDVPLLEGYRHRFLRNQARHPGLDFLGLINAEIVPIVARGTYDALLVNGWGSVTSLAALLSPRLSRWRRTRVLMRGETNPLRHIPSPRRQVRRAALQALLHRVDRAVAIGTLNASFYRDFGVPEERITIAPYSVDNAFFASRSADAQRDPSAARARLGLPSGVTLFLWVAKIYDGKRPFDVLRAFAETRRRSRAALAFVGEGPLLGAAREEAARLGIAADVVFLGFRNQSELPEIYGASDVVVLASEAESWGLVVNEAMACGMTATVSDRVGCAPDLIEPEAVFPCGDVDALSRVLTRFAEDPRWLADMRARARARIARWGVRESADGILAAAQAAMASPART
jgi:glycosyltransferase involved in cell wall biosynthesis